ncbi:hypothetical protein CVS40_11949 [Lucilia cuprina]|nr:hypothetical protein CVS40_11949 [Lucilia cuprina]
MKSFSLGSSSKQHLLNYLSTIKTSKQIQQITNPRSCVGFTTPKSRSDSRYAHKRSSVEMMKLVLPIGIGPIFLCVIQKYWSYTLLKVYIAQNHFLSPLSHVQIHNTNVNEKPCTCSNISELRIIYIFNILNGIGQGSQTTAREPNAAL